MVGRDGREKGGRGVEKWGRGRGWVVGDIGRWRVVGWGEEVGRERGGQGRMEREGGEIMNKPNKP